MTDGAAERRLRRALDAAGLGLWSCDLAADAADADARARALLGLAAEGPLDRAALVAPLAPADRAALEGALAGPAAELDLTCRISIDGAGRQLRLTGRADEGTFHGEVQTIPPPDARIDLDVLGAVCHDLRNPLQAIVMGAHAGLRRPGLDRTVTTALQMILASGERSARMIEDVTALARTRAGALPLARREVDLHELVRQAVDQARLAAPERPLSHRASGAGRGWLDPALIVRMVGHLVSAPRVPGAATAPIAIGSSDLGAWLELDIVDDGLAVPAGAGAAMFEPPRIGLALARAIAIAHGGSADVEPAGAHGARLRVRLPRG